LTIRLPEVILGPMDSVADRLDPQKLAHLKSELASAQSEPAAYPDSLEEAVCDIVDDLKARGRKAEEVIIEIRRLCLESGLSTNHYTSGQANRGISGLVDKIISTCIEHYYS
jgi:hypothetical protein